MAQQTAVEWLEKQYYEGPKWERFISSAEFKKAKQMEKEQIINAHLTGLIRPLEIEATKQAEQYYNETYKQ